jgi:hypothetical protein
MSGVNPRAVHDATWDAKRRADRAREAESNGHDPQYRFTLIDGSEVKLNKRSAYLVKNFIPVEGLIVVWGPPKCGKSFWVIDVAFHIALGWEYRGRRVKQGLAVYIGCEGEFAVPARVEAFRQAKICGPIDPEHFKLILTRLDLIGEVETLIADIDAQLGGRRPAILFIDTLNRSLAGSENSDEDMSNYIKAADRLRVRFQCAVVIIHHCGYNADHPRGHSSLAGAADAQIAVTKNTEGVISTIVEFMKDGPEGEVTASRFKVIDNLDIDEDGEPISSLVLEEIEPPAPKQKNNPKASKLPSPMAMKFWEALNNAGATVAEPRPESKNRPSITEEQWLTELIRRCLIEAIPLDSDKTARKAILGRKRAMLSKYRGELIAANWIACNGPIVWSVKESRN